jgi:hypothetical protein
MEKYYCDKCGCEMDEPFTVINFPNRPNWDDLHLCEKCTEELVEWIDQKKAKP